MISEINFSTLPKDVLSKIPLSLRTTKDVHNFDELPTEIQYLLKSYTDNASVELDYSNGYDFKPEISIYNDAEIISSSKETITEYLQNHLRIVIGSYPFDVNIGSKLKHHLQTKDTSLRETLLSNELYNIIQAMSNQYGVDISIVKSEVNMIQYEDRSEAVLNITIQINDEEISISI